MSLPPVMKKTSLLLPLLFFSLAFLYAVGGPGNTSAFQGKRVLFIGIDGLRNDALKRSMATGAAPNIRGLIDNGMVTWNAFAGGPLNGTGQQPTISGAGWTSLYTGTWTDQHNVVGNSTPAYNQPATLSSYLVAQAPAFATRLKSIVPNACVASISSWSWIEDYLVAAQPASFDYHTKGIGSSYPQRDESVKNLSVSYLASADPDVMMLHFDQVDGAGHASGFSATNPNYINAIAAVDAHVGDVLSALRARPDYDEENWLIILTTDHGGIGTSHGGQSADERTICMALNGPDIPAGVVSEEVIGQPAVAHTVFKHLGVAVDPAWQWAEKSFGTPPSAVITAAGTRALIHVLQPASGQVPGCTGIELYRNGTLVSTQNANATHFIDMPALPPTGYVNFTYEVRFAGTSVTPVTTNVRLAQSEGNDVLTDLVADLSFEGNAQDASGKNNHANVTGTQGYVAGRQGQALVLSGSQYASFPANLTDLQFGSNVNFTVAFWIQCATPWTSDPVIISNKNWSSGTNQGWAIACQSLAANNNTWQWNWKGAAASRKDFDAGGAIIDGTNWHHIAISHTRNGNAEFYADGNLIGTVSIAGSGSIDTGLPLNLGRDGNGGNALNTAMAIDDLKIWRRALTVSEIRSLVPAPTPDLLSNLVLEMKFDGNSNDTSGRNNHGTMNGTGTYNTGRDGMAVLLDTNQYVSLGQPSDLQFGSSTDFTISCWVKPTGAWSSDPALISNKNWASGSNNGWFLGGQNDSSSFQWNYKGAASGATRKDFDSGGLINDGNWHHLAVVHRRAGLADMYQDGTLLGSVLISGSGSVDTTSPLSINIGRDGTGAWAWSGGVLMDDLKIWRRALTKEEITTICPPTNLSWQTWRTMSFSDDHLADPLVSGPTADPDGDGHVNFSEFAFGADPLRVDAALTTPAVTGYGISFLVPPNGTGDILNTYRSKNLLYQIKQSNNLADWSTPQNHLLHLMPGPKGWIHATVGTPNPSATPAFYQQTATDE